jgi:phage I-like protein
LINSPNNAQRNSSQWVAIMRTDRHANLAYEPNSTIENVIFLESAFEIHARLLCCLEYRLRRCVSEGRMLPSKSRQFQDLAQKSGISQLRVMVEAAEQVLAA